MDKLILSLNVGSTSVKSKVFKLEGKGELSEIFAWSKSDLKESSRKDKILEQLFLVLKKAGLVDKIKGVGHRVVHGGVMKKSALINSKTITLIKNCSELAPLHNPFNLEGITFGQKFFTKIPQVAVFDTAFFADLPSCASLYPLPATVSGKYKLKRYGFHGISHFSAAEAGRDALGKKRKKSKIITVHLGGGASIAAVLDGRAVDTSMGFTPLEGLMMSTRAGDLDSGIIFYLARRGWSLEKIEAILLKKSGFLGVSGLTNMLSLLEKKEQGDKKAQLAFEMFVYRVRKYVGAYFAVLGGCDAIVFTGSVGAGKAITRNEILRPLKKTLLKNSKILVWPTAEEKTIAEETLKFLR